MKNWKRVFILGILMYLPLYHNFFVKEHADKITCPTCQSDCVLGPQGVAGLLTDYGVCATETNLDLAGCTGCKSRDSSAVAR